MKTIAARSRKAIGHFLGHSSLIASNAHANKANAKYTGPCPAQSAINDVLKSQANKRLMYTTAAAQVPARKKIHANATPKNTTLVLIHDGIEFSTDK